MGLVFTVSVAGGALTVQVIFNTGLPAKIDMGLLGQVDVPCWARRVCVRWTLGQGLPWFCDPHPGCSSATMGDDCPADGAPIVR